MNRAGRPKIEDRDNKSEFTENRTSPRFETYYKVRTASASRPSFTRTETRLLGLPSGSEHRPRIGMDAPPRSISSAAACDIQDNREPRVSVQISKEML